MTKREFFAALEEIAEMAPNSIQGEEALADLATWDSMSYVSFIAMADERLSQAVSAKQLVSCKSVGDLVALFPGKIS